MPRQSTLFLKRLLPSFMVIYLFGGAAALDLKDAVIVVSDSHQRASLKAATMLAEEVGKRSGIRWPVVERLADEDQRPAILIGQASRLLKGLATTLGLKTWDAREGFQIVVRHAGGTRIVVAGNDARGTLFGVGHLLRSMHMSAGKVEVADDLGTYTAPKYALRGHQLGYRPKTNSYDAWDLPQWEQYCRDLIVFGTNAIELVPPRTDDAPTSPHFPRPQLEMMAGMSRIADEYDLEVWIWYPALDRDYSDPRTIEAAIDEWGQVFDSLPRIDAVFVPGGDPGHTRPKYLMALLERQTQRLHVRHPKAQMWVSPQSFNETWLAEFIDILNNEQPSWLSGVVFGPQVRVSLPKLRSLVPQQYPIRHYPDITHSRQCQYPVPDWDVAYAVTEGRECINPRPVDQAQIFRLLQPYTIGFVTYSEGCNDDVNKFVWSALGWDPSREVIEILREYSAYFIGQRYRDSFAQGLLALERNWRGPLLTNTSVATTLAQFQDLEHQASPADLKNWRFQQALYRAYYDAYVQRRLVYETALEAEAMDCLRTAPRQGALTAIDEAEKLLQRSDSRCVADDLRQRVFTLAEALYQSIGMQTSVSKYKAIDVDRGATLDTLDYPLNNRRWLGERFREIRALTSERQRRQALDEILRWTDPGPGGFYDDLGNTAAQPHLVRGLDFAHDPASLASARCGFAEGADLDEGSRQAWRMSWVDHAESLLEAPLRMAYDHLDPEAQYRLRVLYAGDGLRKKIRLMAGDFEIHPFIVKPYPCRPLEFDIPKEATRGGKLELSWYRESGLGDNGRGCQVSEVWLIRN
jgi:hypothetical protein